MIDANVYIEAKTHSVVSMVTVLQILAQTSVNTIYVIFLHDIHKLLCHWIPSI